MSHVSDREAWRRYPGNDVVFFVLTSLVGQDEVKALWQDAVCADSWIASRAAKDAEPVSLPKRDDDCKLEDEVGLVEEERV